MAKPQEDPKTPDSQQGKSRSTLAAELEAMANVPPPDRRESLGRALLQLTLFFAVLGGVYFAYKQYATNAGMVFNVLKEVRDLQRQDSVDKLKESKTKLEEAIAVKPEGRLVSLLAETDVLLACTYLEQDVMADAEKYTAQAAAEDVARAERYSAEGYLKVCQGLNEADVEKRRAALASAEEYMTKILNKGAADPRVFHALGLAMMAQGRTLEARDVLKQASERGPGNPRFPVSYADVEFRLGNYAEAAQQYGRGVNTNGSHIFARVGKALAEGLGGVEPEKVVRDISKALEATPTSTPTPGEKAFGIYAMAEIAARSGAYTQADQMLTEAMKILGNRVDARHHLLRGKIALLKGDDAGAAKAWDAAAGLEPANPSVYLQPATLLVELGKGDAALARLQAAQKAQVKETPAFHALLGDAHLARGKPEEAAAAYKLALENEEGNVRATMGNGRIFIGQKKWEEAGGQFEKVPQDGGDAWYYMCGAYIEQKDFPYAAQMCDKAVDNYGKKFLEPFYQVRALKLAAKAYDLAKDKKNSEERAKRAAEMEKAQ